MSHVGELAYLHSRDITFAVLCQGRNTAYGPGDAQTSYDESLRYRAFMGWDMPWYSAQPSLDALLVGREHGLFHLVCYLRDGDRVFETYWTKRRGAEALDYSYALMDLTVFGQPGGVGGLAARAGRASGTRPGPWAGLPTGRHCGSGRAVVPRRSGRASMPGTRTIWEPRSRGAGVPLRITATDASAETPAGVPVANDRHHTSRLRTCSATAPAAPPVGNDPRSAQVMGGTPHLRWP